MASIKNNFIFILIILQLNACSAGYIMQAAYEQMKIMSRREKIENVIADPSTTENEKLKLTLVTEAREYAKLIGLDPKKTFRKYAKLDSDVLSWLLLASKPDAFELYTWWFPIVGTVPYKGFFEKEDAIKYSEDILKKGYEISIREAAAFSTLGWFEDPILSTTLKNDEVSIVSTVLHESVHTTLWIKNHVDFNESLANFIGTTAACDFFRDRGSKCALPDEGCRTINAGFLKKCLDEQSLEFEFAAALTLLYQELKTLYDSGADRKEKIIKRVLIFDNHIKPLQLKYPGMKALQNINNAEIMQFKIYLSGFDKFLEFYQKNGNTMSDFIKGIISLKDELDKSDNPYEKICRQAE